MMEQFAKIFDTAHGQFLAYLDEEDEDDGYLIRTVGAQVRGVIPKANAGYSTEEAQLRAFDKLDQQLAEQMAKSLFGVADRFARKVSA